MPIQNDKTLYYRRARFSTRLPRGFYYTPAHYWMDRRESDLWCVGLTRFATRMLGDLVEFGFYPQTGEQVKVGQSIGWIEGFKAVSDIFCAMTGCLERVNLQLEREPMLLDNDPYYRGWLYELRGNPSPDRLDVSGYVELLDTTIDRILARTDEEGTSCPVPGTS